MTVMGSGDIVVGKKPTTRKTPAMSKDSTEGANSRAANPAREEHCGAMSQQRTDSGAASTPQKFLRLVGCRDQKPRQPGGR
jgi:hypothetical protein